ncbi:MAG TPA: EamA family transporter [Actinomycetota bacterium]|nr:EamA family transporter [Actinomycetota bacterium]
MTTGLRNRGVQTALFAAVLFGAATPLAKALLGDTDAWMLAALLYLGCGLGLVLLRRVTRAAPVRPTRAELPWLAGAILAGGVIAPVLLMLGLTHTSAANASLLLNFEGALTALIAWVVFKENVDARVGLGMLAIVAGAMVLSWPGSTTAVDVWPSLAIIGACAAWAIDNNLTRRISTTDATWLAATKGWAAGTVNLVLALALGSALPAPVYIGTAALLGFVSYGLSLALFIVALRHIGTARTGAYFGVAPFVGATLAVALGAPVTVQLLAAGALMAVGVWLHVSEKHEHGHTHPALVHRHTSAHDDQHPHSHPAGLPQGPEHEHRHPPLTHDHPHYPDIHHRHRH